MGRSKNSLLAVVLFASFAYVAPAGVKQAHAGSSSRVHKVRSGDSLWTLSQRSGCSVDRLRRANGLRSEMIKIGTQLSLPDCRVPATRGYTVRAGDTLSEIAAARGTEVAVLQELNGFGSSTLIVVGRSIKVPGAQGKSKAARSSASRSQSVGKPWKGRLVGGVQLPKDPGYYRRRSGSAYGTHNTISQVKRTLDAVRKKHRGLHRLAVGDLSAPGGGPLAGHRSHQSGRDIDLGFYYERPPQGYPHSFVDAKHGRLALGPMWTMVRLFAEAAHKGGGPQYVFLDYAIQKQLYTYARKHGNSRARLRSILQYPDGKAAPDRLVRHEPNHADHLHVRYRCASSDKNCG